MHAREEEEGGGRRRKEDGSSLQSCDRASRRPTPDAVVADEAYLSWLVDLLLVHVHALLDAEQIMAIEICI
jgi:hypothetical protein